LFDQPVDAEVPGRQIHFGDAAVVQDWPFFGQVLAWRKTIGDGPIALVQRTAEEVEGHD
jgi:hypothetical protein